MPGLTMLLLLACAADDADLDGFGADVDCDDGDPFAYPGAPESPGDGVDADCAGGDPAPGWLGGWQLTGLTAGYSGLQLFVPGTTSGSLSIADDGAAEISVSGQLDPEIVGADLAITVALSGAASPIPYARAFSLYAEGENFDEQMHIDWECLETGAGADTDTDANGAGLTCAGELKALDISLDADAWLIR